MSLAIKGLRPSPVDKQTGQYRRVEKQYGGLKRITRAFESDGNSRNFSSKVDESLFDDYGTLDGSTTISDSSRIKTVPAQDKFANCVLEEQQIRGAEDKGDTTQLIKVYQEAYEELREIAPPEFAEDDDGRKTTKRTYIVLNGYVPDPRIGEAITGDVDDATQVLTTQNYREGNATSIVERTFVQATNALAQVGGDKAEKDQNNKWTVTRNFIGTIDAPLGDEEVGTDTTTYDGKTLYLAGIQTDPNATIQLVQKVWREKQILNVSTPKVGGQQRVGVQAIGLNQAEVTSEISEVTASHKLIDVSKGNYQGFQTINYTFEVEAFDVLDATENGLSQLTRTQLAATSFVRGNVGTDTYSSLILAGEEIDNGNTIKKRVSRWAEAGILNTEKEFGRDGLLYVTFEAQGTKFTPTALNKPTYGLSDEAILAFQGGPDANLFRSRTRNVNGFRRYVVTVMMLQNGDPLSEGDNEVNSYQKWTEYKKPGLFVVNFDGPLAIPGANRFLRVNIKEYLSTDPTISNDFKPYSVTNWASYSAQWTPAPKEGELNQPRATRQESKGVSGYLADSFITINNDTFWGEEALSGAASASSSPTPSFFYALSDQVINSDSDLAFTTDEGVKWYRKVKITVDGTFGEYL